MEAIRNYLESMFMNLPNTEQVRRAKEELYQMMEDKYSELIAAGKSENEAVGTVISEFGNLKELAAELGIDSEVHADPGTDRRIIIVDKAKEYLRDCSKNAFFVALGVLLCIVSPTGLIFSDELLKNDAVGLIFFFAAIAIGVALFIAAGAVKGTWKYLREEPCALDFAAIEYVAELRDRYRGTYAMLLTFGIMLCVFSIAPVAILDEMNLKFPHWEMMAVMLLFYFVAAGVFMIVYSVKKNHSYERLLGLNDRNSVAGGYVAQKSSMGEEFTSDMAANILSVYWQTVTCLYLIISFLSGSWATTWLIWPVAGIANSILRKIWKK